MAADDDLDALVADLVGVLRELERSFEPETVAGIPRPPTPREMARFTSEVAIPGAILVLRTNIEALRLLQRTLRMADGRASQDRVTASAVGARARSVSQMTLSRLDDALTDLQAAVEGRPEDDDARELLDRARDLRDEVDARLAAADEEVGGGRDDVPVDVEAELQSIKRTVEDEAASRDPNSGDGGDGDEDEGNDADTDEGE
jgi:hypothetical protein